MSTFQQRTNYKEKPVDLLFRNISKGLICLYLVFSLTGCISVTDYRKHGFKLIQDGFVSIEESPDLYEVVELKNVKIHIVGHRKHFNSKNAAAHGSPIVAYANRNNEISLFGKIVNGKIILNQAILGHELKHLLHFKNNKIADPDKLDDIGM